MYSNNFANLIKQKRTTLNLSQSKVAKLCYLSKASYNHLEHGIRLPSLETLIKLSQALNSEPIELLNAILTDLDRSNYDKNLIQEKSPSYSNNSSMNASFEQLNSFQQKAVLDIIDSLITINNSTPTETNQSEQQNQQEDMDKKQ